MIMEKCELHVSSKPWTAGFVAVRWLDADSYARMFQGCVPSHARTTFLHVCV